MFGLGGSTAQVAVHIVPHAHDDQALFQAELGGVQALQVSFEQGVVRAWSAQVPIPGEHQKYLVCGGERDAGIVVNTRVLLSGGCYVQ